MRVGPPESFFSVQGLPGYVAVGHTILSFPSYAMSVSRSLRLSPSPQSPRSFSSLLSFSLFLRCFLYRSVRFAGTTTQTRKRRKKKQKIDEKERPRGEQGCHKDDPEESPAKWIRYLTLTSSRVPRVSSGTEIVRW